MAANKRARQGSNEEEGTVICQKCDKEIVEKIPCACCKLYYCTDCAKITATLYKCMLDGELEGFHCTCSYCKSMYPTLENISKVVNDIKKKHDDRLKGLEDRVATVERTTKHIEQTAKQEIKENVSVMKADILEEIKGGIDTMVDARNKELEDRKRRELNIAIFNLAEHNHENGFDNKKFMRWKWCTSNM